MRVLVDTHAVIWAVIEPDRLSSRARAAIESRDAQLVISAVSAYEIEFKRERDAALARLPLDLERALSGLGFAWLAISATHAGLAGRLPRHHGDPFDRLIIAQALAEGVPVLSADGRLAAYGAEIIW